MTKRDGFGSVLGILVFLGGVALLLITFRLAYDMFQVPPEKALNLIPGKTLDINSTGVSAVNLLVRVLLLVVMGLVSSFVANRGISLYTACGPKKVEPQAVPETVS